MDESSRPSPSPTFSIVIPIYNEEAVIPELIRRVSSLMEQLEDESELIVIDDGSDDRSLEIVREFQNRCRYLRYLSFARNFGHQVAVTAGLEFAQGRAVVVMDGDLQDPPEVIFNMIRMWRQGYQVVYGQRVSRKREGWLKKFLAATFYRILYQLAEVKIPLDAGDFCLMDRVVVDYLKRMPERNRYIRGMRAWVGFRQTAVQFDRPSRYSGDVKYTFRKSLALAIDGIIGFSRKPLRFATYIGLGAAAVALVMVILVFYWRIFQDDSPVTGFTIIAVAMFFLGGVQLLCLGVLGEYIGRIYDEAKRRPTYTLKETAGFSTTTTTNSNPESSCTSVWRRPA